MTREEHLAWCKNRALEYLDHGDVKNTITSMMSDMTKHPEQGCSRALQMLGMAIMMEDNRTEARRWIEGFN